MRRSPPASAQLTTLSERKRRDEELTPEEPCLITSECEYALPIVDIVPMELGNALSLEEPGRVSVGVFGRVSVRSSPRLGYK